MPYRSTPDVVIFQCSRCNGKFTCHKKDIKGRGFLKCPYCGNKVIVNDPRKNLPKPPGT